MDIIRQRKQGESFKYYFCKPLLILVSKLDTQIGQRLPDVYALKTVSIHFINLLNINRQNNLDVKTCM